MTEHSPFDRLAKYSFRAVLLSILSTIFYFEAAAQSVPATINYQAILRDSETLAPLSEAAVYLVADYVAGPDGEILYQEEFSNLQSGRSGLINIPLGSGSPLIGSFEEIGWEGGNIWLRISVDAGSGLSMLQETPFRTVPYAFYAERSAGDADSDPSNEIQDLNLNNNQLTLTNTSSTSGVDLTPYLDNTDQQTLSLDDNNVLNISGASSPVDLNVLLEGTEDSDEDPNNEIQDLFITDDNSQMSITNNEDATMIDLSPFFDNTDNQELQLSGSELSISGAPGVVDLSNLPGFGEDADADPQNELQNLQLINDSLSLTGISSAVKVDMTQYDQSDLSSGFILVGNSQNKASEVPITGDLILDDSGETKVSAIMGNSVSAEVPIEGQVLRFNSTLDWWEPGSADDADSDSSNELQELSLSGNDLNVTNNPSATAVDLSGYLDNTDNQDLTLSGSTLSLTGDATPVDLSTVPGVGDDADTDSSNELQELSLSGNDLNVTNNPAATPVDLSGYLDNTDNQDLTLSGSTLSLSGDATPVDLSGVPGVGNDNDVDPANELQNLQLAGNFLSLTNVSPSAQIDMSQFDQSALTQGRVLVGNAANEASEVDITGDVSLSNAGVTEVTAIRGTAVSSTAPTNGQILLYNNGAGQWQPQSLSAIISPTTTSYYSIDPLDFRELADPQIAVDLDNDNAIKFFDDDAPFAMLRNTQIVEIMAPVHLPQGATVTNIKIYFHNSAATFMNFILSRKDLTNFATSNQDMVNEVRGGFLGDAIEEVSDIDFEVIDNQTYSYRLFIRFTNVTTQDDPTLAEVNQRIYGAVIEYTTN